MGHNIGIRVFDKETDNMYGWARDYAFYNVDRGENPDGAYTNSFKKHTQIFETKEEAEEFLLSCGAYVDGCVRFKEMARPSKRFLSLQEKIAKNEEDKRAYDKTQTENLLSRKSNLIGCEGCGSRISRKHLKSSRCPVCGSDLRSKTVMTRLAKFDEKTKELKKALHTEEKKQKEKKATIKWLAKVEVHS